MQRGEVVGDDPYLLERELISKREEVLIARYDELETMMSDLEQKELELKEIEAKLTEETKRLEEEKKVLSEKLSEYDNYRENIVKQAEYFTSMPPNAAVERLAQLDDLLVSFTGNCPAFNSCHGLRSC